MRFGEEWAALRHSPLCGAQEKEMKERCALLCRFSVLRHRPLAERRVLCKSAREINDAARFLLILIAPRAPAINHQKRRFVLSSN